MLADSYGRVAADLRVSLTDRCNLRCSYCMPPEGFVRGIGWEYFAQSVNPTRSAERFFEAHDLIIKAWTSTEPFEWVTRNYEYRYVNIWPRPEISLTTNGIGLARLAGPLREAGLDRINVSLDTLRPETFRSLAKRDRLDDVLAGLAGAAAAGLLPVKVNAVLMRGLNEDEAAPLLRYCREHGYQLRFIEQMPLDAQHGWRRADMVTADEILAALSAEFSLTPDDPQARGSAPAEIFLVNGGPDRVGVIGSVTRPFCGACDRVRLTADGQVRNCLFAREESNLRDPMRGGAGDAELAALWEQAVAAKFPGHGINDPNFLQPSRPMSAIGG